MAILSELHEQSGGVMRFRHPPGSWLTRNRAIRYWVLHLHHIDSDHGPGADGNQGWIAGAGTRSMILVGKGTPAPSTTVTAPRNVSTAAAASLAVAAWTMAKGTSGPTVSPIPRTSAKPTAESIASVGRLRPPPKATPASPSARASMVATTPARSKRTSWRTGALGRWRSGFSSKSLGPPSAATIRAKRSAAAPESRACAAVIAAAAWSWTTPPSIRSSAASASVTSRSPGSSASPVRTWMASRTSSALPAVRPRHSFMSVSRAEHGKPAPCATSTSSRASSRADSSENETDLVADTSGGMLVDHGTVQVMMAEAAAGFGHRPGERDRLLTRQAIEEHRHRERGGLTLGDPLAGQPVDELGDLVRTQRAAIALLADDLLRQDHASSPRDREHETTIEMLGAALRARSEPSMATPRARPRSSSARNRGPCFDRG